MVSKHFQRLSILSASILTITLACKSDKVPDAVASDQIPSAHVTFESANLATLDIPNPEETYARFARGWNAFTGRPAGDCALRGTVSAKVGDPAKLKGQRTILDFDYVKSTNQLRSRMSANASASFGMGLFKAEFDYLKERNFSGLRQHLFLTERVLNVTNTLDSLALSSSGRTALSKNIRTFTTNCGTEFVVGTQVGGELFVTFEAIATTLWEYEQLSAKLSAAIGLFRANAGFSQSLAALTNDDRIKVHMYRSGGIGTLPSMTVDKLIAYAENFPAAVADSGGWIINAITTGYEVTTDQPFPNGSPFKTGEIVMAKLAALHDTLVDVRAELTSASAQPGLYPDLNGASLSAEKQSVDALLEKVEAAAARCSDEPWKCTLALIPPGAFSRPERKSVGVYMDDLPYASRIIQLVLRQGVLRLQARGPRGTTPLVAIQMVGKPPNLYQQLVTDPVSGMVQWKYGPRRICADPCPPDVDPVVPYIDMLGPTGDIWHVFIRRDSDRWRFFVVSNG